MKISNSNNNLKKMPNTKFIKLNPVIIKRRDIKQNKENMKIETENYIEQLLSQIKGKKSQNFPSKDFNQYTENIEKSMNGYQMNYSKENEDYFSEEVDLNKYVNKIDKEMFKKIHLINNTYGNNNKNISSKNSHIKIGIEQMEFPNPVKSLGIIRNNQYIFSELNKNNLTRQSESFNKQIEEINHINLKYGKKMPKVHVTINIP